MGTVIVLGLLVGLDNLQVGAALGLAGLGRGRRWAAAAAFGACETLMPLLGLWAGHGVQRAAAETVGVLCLGLCGLLILILALVDDNTAATASRRVVSSRATLVALPVSLSFDNLVAGVGLGSLGYPVLLSALVIGVLSGGLCAFGLFAGSSARRFVPAKAEALAGVFLIVLALTRFLGDAA